MARLFVTVVAVILVISAGTSAVLLLPGCSFTRSPVVERKYSRFEIHRSARADTAIRGTTPVINGVSLTSGTVVWVQRGKNWWREGDVTVNNVSTGGTMYDVQVEIVSINPSSIGNTGPWLYGDIALGTSSAPVTWKFKVGQSQESFTFTVRVSWL